MAAAGGFRLDSMVPPLVEACGRGDLSDAQRIASEYKYTTSDVRGDDNAALRAACKCGCLEIVRWLVKTFTLTAEDARAHHAEGGTALIYACSGGHLEVAKWLTDEFDLTIEDADVYGGGFDETTLECVCANGHLEVAKWMVNAFDLIAEKRHICGDDMQSGGLWLLYMACKNGHWLTVKWIIKTFSLSFDLVYHTASHLCGRNYKRNAIALRNIFKLVEAGEWRPRSHARLPKPYRAAMRTLVLLAKSS